MKHKFLFPITVIVLMHFGCNGKDATNPGDSPYDVNLEPENFLPGDSITGNTYFLLTSGRTMTYLGKDGGDSIRVVEIVLDSVKTILGVECRVVNAKEYENNKLIEDTDDWYAQDRSGNVWYFGEYSRAIKNDQVVSTGGSWESGVSGALPGIIMLAEPLVGLWYRQEYFKGEAEDVAQVLALGETLTVPYGTYNNCLRTLEYSLNESGEENKIYAPGVGLLRAMDTKGGSEYEDLVAVTP